MLAAIQVPSVLSETIALGISVKYFLCSCLFSCVVKEKLLFVNTISRRNCYVTVPVLRQVKRLFITT